MTAPTKERLLTLHIDNLTSDGQGVARRQRDVYFVAGALPGETVEVSLQGRRKQVWQTRLLRVVEAAEQRVNARCPHYQRCGGCDIQHMDYDAQVAFKQQRVVREFERQKIPVEQWQPALIAEPWHYRRKARLGVRYSKERQTMFVGFRESASQHLSNIDQCVVLPSHPALDWQRWREWMVQLDGRAIVTQIEVIVADNALALIFRILKPLNDADRQRLQRWCEQCGADDPAALPLQIWLKADKDGPAQPLQPDYEPLWYQVNGVQLHMGLSDFFQVNAAINQQMVAQAVAWLAPQMDECIWDLFAGHGNFSTALAQHSQQVIAVEVQADMVAQVQQQAQRLSLPLIAQQADLSEAQALLALPQPHAVLLDPPRAGASAAIAHCVARKVDRMVYVACDAATLARDLVPLVNAGYRVIQAGIMDMFPQTHHVETMVLLQRVGK